MTLIIIIIMTIINVISCCIIIIIIIIYTSIIDRFNTTWSYIHSIYIDESKPGKRNGSMESSSWALQATTRLYMIRRHSVCLVLTGRQSWWYIHVRKVDLCVLFCVDKLYLHWLYVILYVTSSLVSYLDEVSDRYDQSNCNNTNLQLSSSIIIITSIYSFINLRISL